MSTNHYGLAVPLALRRFRIAPLCKNLNGTRVAIPRDLAPGLNIVHVLYKRKHRQIPADWEQGHEWIKNVTLSGGKYENLVPSAVADERDDGIRGLPPEMNINTYSLWIYPRYRFAWSWLTRCRNKVWAWWNDFDYDRVFTVYMKRSTFFEEMGLLDDSRPYILLVRQDGKVLYASHEVVFNEAKESRGISKVTTEEWTRYEARLLLEASKNKPVDTEKLLAEERSRASSDFIRVILNEEASNKQVLSLHEEKQGPITMTQDERLKNWLNKAGEKKMSA